MSEVQKYPFIKGQCVGENGKPYGCPVICDFPREACDLLFGTEGEWWIETGGKDQPLALLSVIWMTQEERDGLPEWQGP